MLKIIKEKIASRAQTWQKQALCSHWPVWGKWQRFGKFIRFNFILESLSHLIGKETKMQRCWGKEKEEYSLSICYVLVMLTNSLLLTLHGNLVAEVSGFVSILQINI